MTANHRQSRVRGKIRLREQIGKVCIRGRVYERLHPLQDNWERCFVPVKQDVTAQTPAMVKAVNDRVQSCCAVREADPQLRLRRRQVDMGCSDTAQVRFHGAEPDSGVLRTHGTRACCEARQDMLGNVPEGST